MGIQTKTNNLEYKLKQALGCVSTMNVLLGCVYSYRVIIKAIFNQNN